MLTDVSTAEIGMANEVRVCYSSQSIPSMKDIDVLHTSLFQLCQGPTAADS